MTTSPTSTVSATVADVDDLRHGIYEQIRDFLSPAAVSAVVRCAIRLQGILPHPDDLGRNVVLVAYGGGKDSSYMLAFVRAMQLLLFRIRGTTFRMRSVTNRHAGMPRAVMENIDRSYRALGLFDDPDCELLLIDGDEVHPFDVEMPQRDQVVSRNRMDILMTGHRTAADGRPTFCNSCNLSMVNSFGLAASYNGGVDVIVTGDSREEQRAYLLWVRRLATRFGLGSRVDVRRGFGGFLQTVDDIAQAYFGELYRSRAEPELIAARRVRAEVPGVLQFFSIYEDTDYSAGEHWDLLTEFLKFQFDDLAFSFTESDCANPALMAHLRGLKAERVFGRRYADGIAEYVEFAVALMRRKDFPERLIDLMRERYRDGDGVAAMRSAVETYTQQAYGITPEHLVCMVYAPFAGGGAGLSRYLSAEQPDLSVDEVRALLSGEGQPDGAEALVATLHRISGLELAELRALFGAPSPVTRAGDPGEVDLLSAILHGDPHKQVIRTRHAPDGPVVSELLSGR